MKYGCVWFVFVFSGFFFFFFFFLCIGNRSGFAVLDLLVEDGGSTGNAGWRSVPLNGSCWTSAGFFPQRAALVQIQKMSMKRERDRLQGEREVRKERRENWQTRDKRQSGSTGGLADRSSGKVHGVLGVIVDLDRLCQRLGVPAITLA